MGLEFASDKGWLDTASDFATWVDLTNFVIDSGKDYLKLVSFVNNGITEDVPGMRSQLKSFLNSLTANKTPVSTPIREVLDHLYEVSANANKYFMVSDFQNSDEETEYDKWDKRIQDLAYGKYDEEEYDEEET